MNDGAPKRWGWLLLFASTSTLVCCALPILLVGLGMGAVMASLASSFPFLITLSLYKGWTFSITALLLCLAGWALFRKGRACPADPAYAELCEKAHRWNKRLYWISVIVWILGFSAAYLALPLLEA